jgi:hypothetical protein
MGRAAFMSRASSVVVLLVASGCGDATRELSWHFELATPALAARAVAVDAEIRTGGCDGPPVYRASIRQEAGETPPPLEPGRYGFFGRARDASCVWFAAVCREVDLPLDDGETLALTLESAPESIACSAAICDDGRCPSGDSCASVVEIEWARQLGGGDDDGVDAVAIDGADNVYAVGRFRGVVQFEDGEGRSVDNSSDVYVVSYTSAGEFRWRAAFGGRVTTTRSPS